ncbi:Glycosyltransferase involved in cell wall bisynthesis [Soonwooa buanensis]|uniref:Glycosyltransferase involved in cell wall bisynthesis n=1 Tax=Soonwooa buanensis TaxID=619805 RepID=A0A1T5FIP3_9FLAO|nr:glycosyltransferase [Soonwooa buanensis]SKB95987.1 Glycosyltransferase involved in cell wall bisynthesis [Soonwooa buanensis]
MKSLVFVIESLHLGGAEKSLVTLLQNLDYSQYKVDLITFHSGGFFRDMVPEEVNQIDIVFPRLSLKDRFVYALQRKIGSKRHHAQKFWPLVKKYFSRLDKEYDIAIAYNQGFATYFVHDFVQANMKYAWLNTDYQKAGYAIGFDYPFYKDYDKVITVSPQAEQSLKASLQNVGKQLDIEVIKDISDVNMIQQQANQDLKIDFDGTKINIVSVGRLVEYKAFDLAVDACKILVDKNYPIQWYVVGEGNERASLEEKIKSSNLTANFYLLGADPNPYPYMKACDIYVQTSLFEGLGLTVIEAAILHKPIVCTDFPTAHGILKHNETGLIVDMNAEAVAHHIERLIVDRDLSQRFVRNLENNSSLDKETSLVKINELFS